jgi:hypothetical protein
MTKDEREKVRDNIVSRIYPNQEWADESLLTEKLIDYCDKLEARCEKLESRLGKYLDAMEIFVVAMREAADCVAEDEQALAQGKEEA